MKLYAILGILFLIFAFAMSSLSLAEIKEEDFVGYWLLDDGKGDEAKDLSGNNHHGEITDGKWVKGQIDGGLEFDGASTFIEVEHHEDFNLGESLTVAAWAKIDAIPMDHIGIPRKESEYVLHPTNAGGDGFNLRFYIGMGGAWQPAVVSNTVVNYGEWHHLAGAYDGKELKVFIDGKVDKSQPQEGETGITPNPLRWSNDHGGRMLEGILDELAILDRALDEAEMAQLMEGILTAQSVRPEGKLAVSWGSIKEYQ